MGSRWCWWLSAFVVAETLRDARCTRAAGGKASLKGSALFKLLPIELYIVVGGGHSGESSRSPAGYCCNHDEVSALGRISASFEFFYVNFTGRVKSLLIKDEIKRSVLQKKQPTLRQQRLLLHDMFLLIRIQTSSRTQGTTLNSNSHQSSLCAERTASDVPSGLLSLMW